jgi:dipeptidyl aminopeptidase/acylaminoacyl peptidase
MMVMDDVRRENPMRALLTLPLAALLALTAGATASAQTKSFAHPRLVRAIAFSPDGKTVATGCQSEPLIRLWDVATGKARTIEAPGGAAFLAFSPDGKMLAAGGLDNTVYLWDPASGKEIRRLAGHEKFVTSAVFSPDGKMLATGSQDNTVRFWDPIAAKEMGQLKEDEAINAIAFAPDGKTLAVVGWFKEVHLWDVAGAKITRTCTGHQAPCVSVAFSPDGRLLATGSLEPAIRLWEVHSGLEIRKIDEPRRQANALAFAPNSRLLLTAFDDRSVRLLDLARLWDPKRGPDVDRNEEHQGPVFAAAFSNDGKFVASGASDGKMLIRDITAVTRTLRQPGEALPAAKLESHWRSLGNTNPYPAYRAIFTLGLVPNQTMPLFKERLEPFAELMDRDRVGKLVNDLNDDSFAVRDKARKDLEKMGALVEPLLKKSLTGALPSLEMRRLMERILDKIKADQSAASTDMLRALRSVAVLETIGSPEAKHLLEKFARGMPESTVTQESKAALERLARRPVETP